MKETMKRCVRNREVRRVAMLAGGCVVLSLLASPAARAQLGIDTAAILAGLESVNSTMQSVMQAPMQAMQQINSDLSNFTQNTVYPTAQITAAQGLAGQTYSAAQQSQSVIDAPISSAQLPGSQQLESALLSKDPNQVQNVSSLYQQTYGTLPSSQTAPSNITAAVDMGDAAAMEAMKKAINLDALAEREMEVSQQLLHQLQTSAPGNAPIIAAQASAWVLQGHAYSQSALAQLLRVQAAELGYTGAGMKHGAAVNGNSTGAILSLPVGGQ